MDFNVLNVDALDGGDFILGTNERNILRGGAGDDEIRALGGDDHVKGDDGDDFLLGQQGNDKIRGGAGNDLIDGGDGDDDLWGDPGEDILRGKNDNDILRGQGQDDLCLGGLGDDTLYGGPGNDELRGEDGDDDLIGDTGNDTLLGGTGNDLYVYALGDGTDTINDLQGNNTLVFRGIRTEHVSTTQLTNGSLQLDIERDGTVGQVTIVGWEGHAGWSIAYEEQPNVVLIFADDLGYGDVEPFRTGSSTGPQIYTPSLQRMADEGTSFFQFYSGASHCPPARSSLMEGRHTGNTNVNSTAGASFLCDELPVLPKLLELEGYQNGLVGKWGMGTRQGSAIAKGDPTLMGFDLFLGSIRHRDAHAYYLNGVTSCEDGTTDNPFFAGVHQRLFGFGFPDNGTSTPCGTGPATIEYCLDPTQYTHDEFESRALEAIDIFRRNGPLFLYFPTTIPHAEIEVPADAYIVQDGNGVDHDYLVEVTPDVSWHPCECQYCIEGSAGSCSAWDSPVPCDTSSGTNQYPRWNDRVRATYAAMVSRLDRTVGRILDRLEELRLDSSTLVLFTSDNGPSTEANLDPTFFDSTAGLRGTKHQLLEGGIRMPFIAWRPGSVAPGARRETQAVALWDVLPTLADMIGVSTGDLDAFLGGSGSDGQSFLPLLTEPPGSFVQPPFQYWEHHSSGLYRQAIRVGDLKLLRRKSNDSLELYDLASDPGEALNLIGDVSLCAEIVNMVDLLNAERSPEVVCLTDYPETCGGVGTPSCPIATGRFECPTL